MMNTPDIITSSADVLVTELYVIQTNFPIKPYRPIFIHKIVIGGTSNLFKMYNNLRSLS
jgi:hypothetical protein